MRGKKASTGKSNIWICKHELYSRETELSGEMFNTQVEVIPFM